MAEGRFVKGGSFLLPDSYPEDIFTPEDFSEEHRMFAKMTEDFVDGEIMPRLEEIDAQNFEVTKLVLRKCAALDLCAIEIPEEYGGLDLDKATAMLVSEKMAKTGSFATVYGAHAGIGTLPLVYYGNHEQKKKYLPKLLKAEMIGAYALTEPWSGSDALAMRSTARLSEDGRFYVLNGTKQFISNAGFADLFTVFAKIDGADRGVTAFLVERTYPGFSTGAEEKKMGIHGSSTRQLILEDVKVPVENLLGEPGKGHYIAFNILNIGRFKLGAGSTGGAKLVLGEAVKYGLEREQFKTPLVKFGLIREKIADMAVKIFAAETMTYRTAGLIDSRLSAVDKSAPDAAQQTVKGIEEYQVECSIIKVVGSEVLDFAVDEGLQMLGGYGYLCDYPMERPYRDSRVNRLYEGTNEINRLIIPGTLLKWSMQGRLPLLKATMKIMEEMTEISFGGEEDTSFMAAEKKILNSVKKVALLCAGMAAQKYGDKLIREQMVLGAAADMIIEAYAMESVYARAKKMQDAGDRRAELARKLASAYIYGNIGRVELLGRKLVAAMAEGDELRVALAAVRRFTKHVPINIIALKDEIAEACVAAKGYPFKY